MDVMVDEEIKTFKTLTRYSVCGHVQLRNKQRVQYVSTFGLCTKWMILFLLQLKFYSVLPVSKPSRCRKKMVRSFSAIFRLSRCKKSITLSKTHVSSFFVLVFPEKSSLSGVYALAMI